MSETWSVRGVDPKVRSRIVELARSREVPVARVLEEAIARRTEERATADAVVQALDERLSRLTVTGRHP